MHRALLVARHEYLRFVRRRAFLFGTFGFPLLLVLIAGIAALFAINAEDRSIGYLDESGEVLAHAVLEDGRVQGLDPDSVRAFRSERAGREAVQRGDVDVFFIIPESYLEERSATAVLPAESGESVGNSVRRTFGSFVEASLAYRYGPNGSGLLTEGPSVTLRTGDREVLAGPGALLGFAVPFGAGLLFFVAAISSGGYLLQAIGDEKENRTVEILATSVSPEQLIVGKTAGLVGVALTQMAVWAAGAGATVLVAAQLVPLLSEAEVPWGSLGLVVLYFVPAFLLLAGIMVSIGSVYSDYRQSQQIVALVNILFILPFFFMALLVNDPGGGLATALTLFPTTSLITVSLRSAVGAIPAGQLVASWAILAVCAGAAVAAAPRVFRAGMLHYGKRLELGASWEAIRGSGRRS